MNHRYVMMVLLTEMKTVRDGWFEINLILGCLSFVGNLVVQQTVEYGFGASAFRWWLTLWKDMRLPTAAVPDLFGTRNRFHGR